MKQMVNLRNVMLLLAVLNECWLDLDEVGDVNDRIEMVHLGNLTKKGQTRHCPLYYSCGAFQDSSCHDGQCRVLASTSGV